MTHSRFRFRRSGRKPVLGGDFPDTSESITEVLARVRPADYDGTTVTFGGASGAGLDPGSVYGNPGDYEAKGWGPDGDPDGAAAGLRQAVELTAMGERGRDTRPMAAPEPAPGCPCCPNHHPGEDCPGCGHSTGAITGICYPAPVREEPAARQVSGKGWTMTVSTGGPGAPWNARLRAAHTFLRLKWAYLEQRGMGYRVDEADQVMQRGEELPAGSVIAETHREAVTHLIGHGEPWEPAGGWNHGWAADLPWYDRHPDDQAARP